MAVRAVISDFGGVLTSPLSGAFAAFEADSGIPLAELGRAMAAESQRLGGNPLFALEVGQMSEADFLDGIAGQLTRQLDREVSLEGFGERYFADLEPNEPMIAFMRALRGRGLRMAICTNNVREWQHRWRAMLPVQEIFEVVVDSAHVGMRKPDPEIYALTVERLGVDPGEAVFVDDIEINCDAARAAGLIPVWFRTTEQAVAEVEAALAESA